MKTLGDRRLWALAFSYAFVMALYMFWLGWTTVYLVGERKLTPIEANQFFAWIPPVFATVGGFLSGGLAFRWIRRGQNCFHARMRIAWWSAPLVLVTAAVPWVASTRLAVLLIGLSLLFCMSVITSLNIIPVDLFGRENAGFTVAILASAYAFMQAVISPLIGSVVDRYGFAAVCVTLSVFPTLGVWVLHVFTKQRGALVSPDAADLGGVS
jgi:sugar phosphate permease